jgi:hypothetical protein
LQPDSTSLLDTKLPDSVQPVIPLDGVDVTVGSPQRNRIRESWKDEVDCGRLETTLLISPTKRVWRMSGEPIVERVLGVLKDELEIRDNRGGRLKMLPIAEAGMPDSQAAFTRRSALLQ